MIHNSNIKNLPKSQQKLKVLPTNTRKDIFGPFHQNPPWRWWWVFYCYPPWIVSSVPSSDPLHTQQSIFHAYVLPLNKQKPTKNVPFVSFPRLQSKFKHFVASTRSLPVFFHCNLCAFGIPIWKENDGR